MRKYLTRLQKKKVVKWKEKDGNIITKNKSSIYKTYTTSQEQECFCCRISMPLIKHHEIMITPLPKMQQACFRAQPVVSLSLSRTRNIDRSLTLSRCSRKVEKTNVILHRPSVRPQCTHIHVFPFSLPSWVSLVHKGITRAKACFLFYK